MNSNEIQAALKYIVGSRILTYTVCTPNSIDNSYDIIVSNVTEYPGRHWILFFKNKPTYIYYDSYGESSQNYSSKFNVINVSLENCTSYQTDTSAFCGHFALFVAYHLVRDMPFRRIMCKFKTDKLYNERLVLMFYNKHIKPYITVAKRDECIGCTARKYLFQRK